MMLLIVVALLLCQAAAFQLAIPPAHSSSSSVSSSSSCSLSMAAASTVPPPKPTKSKKGGYVPKWKKKQTLADADGGNGASFEKKGLKGNIVVKFQQGNETCQTMALAGQPLRDVASQAGQFIKYGCGKGECGTCECLVDGAWIRPCTAKVPAAAKDNTLIVQVKQVKSKAKSSGKFYSIRSFFMGFYNNLLGMVGFVKYRRAAKQNWEERQEYEDLIRLKTAEKRAARLAREAAAAAATNGKKTGGSSTMGGLKP